MLQLTQAVKHEPYHTSALALFLLTRAWEHTTIGHTFYWFLKAEMHVPAVSERYTILLEIYLRGAKPHRQQLLSQQDVLTQLVCSIQPIAIVQVHCFDATLLRVLNRYRLATKSKPLRPRSAWMC
jgi:hypothetical protein